MKRSLLAVLVAGGFSLTLSRFTVHTPGAPVTAVYGQYTVLSCSFPAQNESSLDQLVVSWQRVKTGEVVYSYYYGKEQLSRQSPRYSGRTSLFPEELKRGNVSVKLDRVRPDDAGQYLCFVSNAKGRGQGIVSLIFAARFTVHTPGAPVTAVYGQYTVLSCSFPAQNESSLDQLVVIWQCLETGEVVYSYYYGKEQLSRQSPRYSGRTSLFPEELKRGNVSVKLDRVRPDDAGQYVCIVSNAKGSGQGIVSLIFAEMKTDHVPEMKTDHVLTRNRWMLAVTLAAIAFIIFILAIAVYKNRASLANGEKENEDGIT